MIISHSRKFILVKSRKTASTSLEAAIIPQLAAQDVWTPISLPVMAGRNYYSLWPADVLTAKWNWFRDRFGKDNRFHHRYFYDHIAMSRIQRMLPAAQVESYTKFCFDRNPWDYCVSSYFYMRRKGRASKLDFDRYLHEFPIRPNWKLYTDGQKLLVDKVFRFEELSSAAAEIEAMTGLTLGELPALKRSYRPAEDYRSYYNQSTRDLVAERWKSTIELLGYDF